MRTTLYTLAAVLGHIGCLRLANICERIAMGGGR